MSLIVSYEPKNNPNQPKIMNKWSSKYLKGKKEVKTEFYTSHSHSVGYYSKDCWGCIQENFEQIKKDCKCECHVSDYNLCHGLCDLI